MISVHGLSKRFKTATGTVDAVAGVSFDVAEGELVAVLGPNGAGKSTTMRMLTTLLAPTSGTARVAGHDIVEDPASVRRSIGFIGQGNGAGHSFRVDDELISQGRFYGLGRADARKKATELLDALDLADLATRTVSTLSGGQRRRLDIAMGLVNEPRVLFLDEPSTGMDPSNRAGLWDHISSVRRRTGAAVVLTTHYLEEADAMAERVIIIDAGTIIANDTAANLKRSMGGDRITVTVPHHQGEVAESVIGRRGEPTVTRRGEEVEVSVGVPTADTELIGLITDLRDAAVDVLGVRQRQPSLDDVFLHLTGRNLDEAPAVAA
jgi:ABC-2 type transport system ATP-binding protein